MSLPAPLRLSLVSAAVICAALLTSPLSAQQPAGADPAAAAVTDLDVLMERVLKNRDQAWRRLQEYLLAERETFRLLGPDGSPMFGQDREFLWVAREGHAVRSPVRVNGVAIGDEERARQEAKWREQEDARAERAARRTADAAVSPGDMEAALRGREPRFISEVQFLRFRFEPGNYYFVGRETLAGRDVLRIEYYPRRLLFADHEDDHPKSSEDASKEKDANRDRDKEIEAEIERAMNKVSLVTLWVDPAVDQVVRYTFDNVDFNFLPGRSFVRVDTARASMTMGQPFSGVWLPESLVVEGAITLATGTYRAEYTRRFRDYRQAEVQVRFR